MATAKPLKLTLELNKETKGAVRYGDDDRHSIYFKKEEVAKHKLGDKLEVTIRTIVDDE